MIPALDSAWRDDTTLGWVYQYWNDPEREALDEKIGRREKIEPHKIASKTQMFTEHMVKWLLQNSLGLTWLSICKKNGWTPDAETVLPVLDARRVDWRKKRAARYYEEIGHLNSISNEWEGEKSYTDKDIQRLKFIKRLKHLGLTLSEMHELEVVSNSSDE